MDNILDNSHGKCETNYTPEKYGQADKRYDDMMYANDNYIN